MDADDYGELIRFWLQVRTGEEGSITRKLATKLNVSLTAVGYWVRGERHIPETHWREIAKHFGFPRHPDTRSSLDALIAEARRLWTIPENRSYYRPPIRPPSSSPPSGAARRATPNRRRQTRRARTANARGD